MSLYTISNYDNLPRLHQPKGLSIRECDDIQLLSKLGNISADEATNRLANDHLAFVAYIHEEPAAFGWLARGRAVIGELNHSLVLPISNRYLWNFRTLEAYRGLGIYPALLQYIIQYKDANATRFWIIHAPENNASLKGITKAGFQYLGKLYLSADGSAVLEAHTDAYRHRGILEDMNIKISRQLAASCWNCSSPYLKKRKEECCCEATSKDCFGKRTLSIAS